MRQDTLENRPVESAPRAACHGLARCVALAALVLAACGERVTAPVPSETEMPPPLCRSVAASTEVRWLVPQGGRQELDAWCGAVGPALVRPMEPALVRQAGGSDAPSLDSLLVVSWNMHVGGGDLRGLVADLRAGVLTGGPIEHFVLLAQEAYRAGAEVPPFLPGFVSAGRIDEQPPRGARTTISELADELGLHLVYVPSMRNGVDAEQGEDRGNAILSTLPLAAPVALELPVERQRRVAVAATVQGRGAGGDWSLQVASVHLENRGRLQDGLGAYAGVSGRVRQAGWLLSALPPAQYAVLAGDLNTWIRGTREPIIHQIARRYPDTSEGPSGVTQVRRFIFRARVDYIFARLPGGSMSGYVRAPVSYGSDHYPLLAWVHFGGSTADGRARAAPGAPQAAPQAAPPE